MAWRVGGHGTLLDSSVMERSSTQICDSTALTFSVSRGWLWYHSGKLLPSYDECRNTAKKCLHGKLNVNQSLQEHDGLLKLTVFQSSLPNTLKTPGLSVARMLSVEYK